MNSDDTSGGEEDDEEEEVAHEEDDDDEQENEEESAEDDGADDGDAEETDENGPINPSSIDLVLKGRNFVTSKKPVDLGASTVVAHNKNSFNSAVWEIVRPHCFGWGFCNPAIANRIIKKQPNNWDTKDWPPTEDSSLADSYYVLSLSKRPYVWKADGNNRSSPALALALALVERRNSFRLHFLAVITDKTVRRWNGKTIVVTINQYGAQVSSLDDWKAFQAAILQPVQADRAGAPAESVTQSILKRLHEQHGSFLTAEPAAWRIWAADIASHPNADHDRLIQTGVPPSHAILLFKTKDVATEVARQAKTSALNRSAVKTYRKQQDVLKAAAKNLVELAATFQRQAIVLQTQIDAFDVALDAFEDLDQAISTESRPVPVPEGRELRSEDDVPDDEH